MAQEFSVQNITMAMSVNPESTYNNTPAGNYHRFVTSSATFHIQSAETFDDRGKVGLGTDLPNIRFTGYLNPVSLDIADNLDNFIHAMIMRRGLGTTSADLAGATTSAGTYTHTVKLAPTLSIPVSSTFIWSLGGAAYAWNGGAVGSFRAEGTRSDTPNFTATVMTTGKAVSTTGLTLNSYVVPHYMDGAETSIYYTKNSTLIYLADRTTGVQRVTGWNVSVNNNNRNDDKRPGDPRVNPATPVGGHYINRMTVGQREVTGEVTFTLDELNTEVTDSLANQVLTDFTISCKGRTFIGTDPATTVQPEIKFIFPKCYMTVEEGVNDNNLAVLRASIFPVYDSTAETSMKIVVTNETPVLI